MSISPEELLVKIESGEDLAELKAPKLTLKKAKLDNARLARADLSRCVLAKSSLKGADLSGAELTGADLSGCDLSGADLSKARLNGANLRGALLKGARAAAADFSDCYLSGAQLDGLQAAGAIFKSADLAKTTGAGLDLKQADLSEADAGDCEWSESDLSGAKLAGAVLSNAHLTKLRLAKADLSGADFGLATLTDCDLSEVRAERADFGNALLERCELRGAQLERASFAIAELKQCGIEAIAVERANFKSVSGLSEAELNALKGRGALINLFLMRRAARFVYRSHLAKLVLLIVIGLTALGAWHYVTSPKNWSFLTLMNRAQQAMAAGQPERAVELYDVAIAKFPDSRKEARALLAKGQVLNQIGRYELAQACFDQVKRDYAGYDDEVVGALLGTGDNLYGRGKYNEAEKVYRDLINDWPGYPQAIEAYIRIAKIYDETGRAVEAKAIYDELMQLYGENEQARLRAMTEEANFHASRHQYDMAIELNRKIVVEWEGQPPAVQARGRLVVLYAEIGQPEQAQKIADEIRAAKPEDLSASISADLTLANYYSSAGQYPEAERRFRAVIEAHPRRNDISWAREALAGLYANQGRFAEAEQQYLLLIDQFDDQPAVRDKARIDLADVVQRSGDLQRAEKMLDDAVRSKLAAPVQGRALLSLADLEIKLGRHDRARELFERVVKTQDVGGRDAAQARMGLARLEDALGRPAKAIELYRQIAGRTDDPAVFLDAQNQIAQIHLREDPSDSSGKAEAAYRAVVERFPDNPDAATAARMNLAEISKRRGDFEAAERIYLELAQSVEPSKATGALNALMRLYSELDQRDKMEQVKQELARRFPADAAAQIDAELESANMLARKGDYQGAIAIYRRVVEQVDGQRESVALEALVSANTSMGDLEGAERVLADLRQRHPAEMQAISNAENALAAAYRQRGRFEQALALYEAIRGRKTMLSDEVRLVAADNIAQTYVQMGDFARAERLYKELLDSVELKRNPLNRMMVQFGLGMLYENTGRRDAALALYNAMIADKSMSERGVADAMRAIVRVYAALGQVDQAQQWVKRYVQRFPDDSSAYLDCRADVASALASTGRFPEALQAYREVSERAADQRRKSNALNAQAQILANMGRYDEAAALYKNIIEQFPQLGGLVQNAEFALADISVQRRRYDDALRRYAAILERYDDQGVQVRALSATADIQIARGDAAAAEATYHRLLEGFDDNDARIAGAMGLASLLRQRGDYAAALQQYEQALGLAKDQNTRNSLETAVATTYGEMGDRDKMVQVYSELAARSPAGSPAWFSAVFEQAQALRNLGRFDEAIGLYDKLTAQGAEPNTRSRALLSRGQALLEAGRLDEAGAAFQKTITEFPSNQGVLDEARTGLATVAQSKGDNQRAAQLLKQIIDTTQSNNQRNAARIALARLSMDQGDAGRAEQILQQILGSSEPSSTEAYSARMTLGEVYRRSGRGEKALQLYRELLRSETDSNRRIDLLNSLASTELGLGRNAESIRSYQQLIEQYGDQASTRCSAQLGIAGIYLLDRQYAKAEQYYQKIIDGGCDPNSVFWAYSSQAQIRSQTGRFDEAVEIYQKLGRLYPDNAQFQCDSKLNRANTLRYNRQYAEALSALEDVAKTCPGPGYGVNALGGIAQIHMERNDLDKARRAYERLKSAFPNDPRAKDESAIGLANLSLMRGQPDQAINGFRGVFERGSTPDLRLSAAINLGRVLTERGRFDEAQAVYNKLARDFKTDAGAQVEAYIGLGQVAKGRGNFAAAEQSLRRAQQVSPDPGRATTALEILAGLYVDKGQWAKVDALLKEINDKYPGEFNPQLNIRLNAANGSRAQGQNDRALRYLDEIIKNYSTYSQAAWALHTKAQILLDAGKPAEARLIYERLIKDYADNLSSVLDAHIGLGNVFMAEQKFPEALAKYQFVATKWPDQPQAVSALFSVANLYQQLGNLKEHEAFLKKIITTYPDNPQAKADASQALGNLYWQLNRPSEALSAFETALKTSPNNCQKAWSQSSIGRVYFQQGQIDESEKRFRDIVDHYSASECPEVVQDAKQFLQTLYQKP